jgi:choline dehydrogenase-like flavoprotein
MMNNRYDKDIILTGKEVLIIGGGTMGLFLANELIKKGRKVVIVEAGNENLQSFESDEFTTVGQFHSGVSIGRTKAIGGTSNLWGGQLARFIENDIESKNNYNQPNWPISWSELHPYYKATFALLGFENSTSEYSKILTDDLNYLEKFHTYWLKQPNFKSHYYTILQKSPLVKIFSDAIVTDLDFESGTCISIKIKDKNGCFSIKGFEKIVFAQGTIEIIRLLLKTKSKENCPYKNNQFIGKYFQDHLGLKVAKIKNPSKSLFNEFANTIKSGNKLQPKIRLIPQKSDNEYLGMSSYFSFASDISQNLDLFKQFMKALMGRNKLEMNFAEKVRFFFKSIKSLRFAFPLIYRYVIDNKIYIPFNSQVSLCLQTQQISIEQSSILIDEKLSDSNGMPKVILNWKIDGREFKRINLFCDQIVKFISDNNYGEVVFEPWYEKEIKLSNNEWMKSITDTYHIAGGTIMSTDSSNGVVDENLKLHQTNNIFIAGPAVLPTSSYANTGLTALALVVRLSEHL